MQWLDGATELNWMTGIGHIELLKVTKYNFHASREPFNSYIKLQAGIIYTSLPKYPIFEVIFMKLLLNSFFSYKWKSGEAAPSSHLEQPLRMQGAFDLAFLSR